MTIWPKAMALAFILMLQTLYAGESSKEQHSHKPDKHEDAEARKDDHHHHDETEKKSGHQEGHRHDHEHEEPRANVGPNKGVLEADEHAGFVLNDTAEKNFAIQKKAVTGRGPHIVPASALLFSGMEKQIFRYRDRRWKAVDIEIVRKDKGQLTIKSEELGEGDSVAITGVGFLKIVEQSVFGPEIEGHVH